MPKSGALERRLFLFLDLFMADKDADYIPYTAWWVLPYYYNVDECPFGLFGTENRISICSSNNEGFMQEDTVPGYYENLSAKPEFVLEELKRSDTIYKDDIKELIRSGCKVSKEKVDLDEYIFYDDPYAMKIQYEDSNNDDYRELLEKDFIEMLSVPSIVQYVATMDKTVRKTLFKIISTKYILKAFNPQDVRKDNSLSRLVHVMYDILMSEHHLIKFTNKEYMEKYNTNERQMSRDIAVLSKLGVEKTIDKEHVYTLSVKRDENYWEEWANE